MVKSADGVFKVGVLFFFHRRALVAFSWLRQFLTLCFDSF